MSKGDPDAFILCFLQFEVHFEVYKRWSDPQNIGAERVLAEAMNWAAEKGHTSLLCKHYSAFFQNPVDVAGSRQANPFSCYTILPKGRQRRNQHGAKTDDENLRCPLEFLLCPVFYFFSSQLPKIINRCLCLTSWTKMLSILCSIIFQLNINN